MGIRRVVLWALAGACLSPVVGLPIWSATDGSDRDHLPVLVALAGAVVGAAAAVRFRNLPAGRASKLVSVAYPTMIVSWIVAISRGYLAAGAVIALAAAGAALARRLHLHARMRAELWKFAAGTAWVATVLLMPISLLGVVVIPLAVSLTVTARIENRHAAPATVGSHA